MSTWPNKTYGPSTGPADWPEDNHLENGNYLNICCHCAVTFVGHKNRVCCKLCANKAKEQSK